MNDYLSANCASLIQLNPLDNVAVARESLGPAGPLEQGFSPVARGHKIALRDIAVGEAVLKYGQLIGHASQAIRPGQHVHTHNLVIGEVALLHNFCAAASEPDYLPESERSVFQGYPRADGRIGTRNYIAILSSVNCSSTVSKRIADHFAQAGRLDAFPNVDGVVALTHAGGCAMNTQSEGYRYLTGTMAGYAINPNVGGVLMLGLGCETNQVAAVIQAHNLVEGETLRAMTIQEAGGTRRTIEAGILAIEHMLPVVNRAARSTQSAAGITLALECGGSDGYSGISANPALGYAVDLLIRNGGTAVLSETPEIYGAEHLLTRRAARPEVAQKLLQRIEWWRDYAKANKAELNNNPSHGNKAGGLSTVLEKSLGGVAKSGNTRMNAVYEYAEQITEKGFVFMDTPGYDPMAVTGQIAGGCNMVCFTTGRGSVSGFKPAPSIKLASNTPMYERMREDMDINCGTIVTGDETIAEAGQRIFQCILDTASGQQTASEALGYGDNEFVPWQVGAVM